MDEGLKQHQFRKSKRNFSDLQPKFGQLKNFQNGLQEQKFPRPKANSIKINRNRLPPDFFPRTQSLRKKVSSNRPSINAEKDYFIQPYRKAQSQRNHISPEKTSFFGFFEQVQRQKKGNQNMINNKRQFESRNQPKRQRMYIQQRNFTPNTRVHRADILEMFPASHDQILAEAFSSSKKIKQLQISPRKQHLSKYKQAQQSLAVQDPESFDYKKEDLNEIINNSIGTCQEIQNITFFNVKSISFPPIYKNKSST